MGFDGYVSRTGIVHALPHLREVADSLVTQINREAHVYEPRKLGRGRRVNSQGWQERLRNYEWQPKRGFDGVGEAVSLTAEFEPLARGIDAGKLLSDSDNRRLLDLVKRTFFWGGVQRGKNKENPTLDEIIAVIRSAHRWIEVGDAFMDAGWTKVAAFSTAWVEAEGRTPQIIYDSRVATGLIRNVEKLALAEGSVWPSHVLPLLQTHLRTVPGRNAEKLKSLHFAWKSGYRQWNSQFFGSFLVSLMRDSLNASPKKYGLMPTSTGEGVWTVRGVEMVLFMEGY